MRNARAHGFAFFPATGRMFLLYFSKLAYSLPFSLETSCHALVAKAFHCETAFSATPEFDNSLVAEK